MLYCKRCSVSVSGNPPRCPLCQGDLSGTADQSENTFPAIAPATHRKFIQLIIFFTVVAAAVCVAINLSFPSGGWWSAFIVAGILSLWINFAVIVKKRENLPKSILWQVSVVSILAVIWDWFTGFHKWSVDYVIPILCTCAMIAMAVVAKIIRLRIEDYIIYLILDSVLGIISLIFIICGVLNVVYPSAICVAASIISLAALFVFEGTTLRAEIRRRMHL